MSGTGFGEPATPGATPASDEEGNSLWNVLPSFDPAVDDPKECGLGRFNERSVPSSGPTDASTSLSNVDEGDSSGPNQKW